MFSCIVDMWSVGCIFAEMLTGETLFPAEDHVDLLNRIVTLCGKPSAEEISDYISNDVCNFVKMYSYAHCASSPMLIVHNYLIN